MDKKYSLVDTVEKLRIQRTSEVLDMCDVLVSRLENNVTREITVYSGRDAYYVAGKLLAIGKTGVMVKYHEETDCYKFQVKVPEAKLKILEGVYIIE